jgi:hypothetical protein
VFGELGSVVESSGLEMVRKQEAVVVLGLPLSPPWRSIAYILDPGVRLYRTKDEFE